MQVSNGTRREVKEVDCGCPAKARLRLRGLLCGACHLFKVTSNGAPHRHTLLWLEPFERGSRERESGDVARL